jgi:hypothetical protein
MSDFLTGNNTVIGIKKRDYHFIIVSTVLILSFLLNVGLIAFMNYDKESTDIIGTFCTGDGMSDDDEYIVFTSEKSYTIFDQFNIVEEGAYVIDDNNVFTLLHDNNEDSTQVYFANGKIIRLSLENNKILVYSRLTNIPTFINV